MFGVMKLVVCNEQNTENNQIHKKAMDGPEGGGESVCC